MEYRKLDYNDLVRAWTFCVMLKEEVGILQPVSLNLETLTMVCEKVDGNLACHPELVTDENRDVLIECLMKGISSLGKKGLMHLSLTPSNIWIRSDPPALMIGGFEKCAISKDPADCGWQTSGIVICLYLLRGNHEIKTVEPASREINDNIEPDYEPNEMMMEIKQQLAETVAIFVSDEEKRSEVLNNAFILFSTAMKTGQSNIEDAKKYIMFSIYVALNLSMVKIDYPMLPSEIGNIEWYGTFISSLSSTASPRKD